MGIACLRGFVPLYSVPIEDEVTPAACIFNEVVEVEAVGSPLK